MSITTPAGFVAAGLACGIKASGALDLALLATEDGRPVPTAATFTRNLACAAPVQVSRAHLAANGGRAAAVLVSSGNANAATGDRGRADAATMCRLTAEGLGVAAEEVLVCSTGLIGIPLPMGPIEAGIPAAGGRPGRRSRRRGRCGGWASSPPTRGARRSWSPIRPSPSPAWPRGRACSPPTWPPCWPSSPPTPRWSRVRWPTCWRAAVADSFNSMTVDGCTSTNDTVVLMASGRAGTCDPNVLADAVTEACADLAAQMAADAEGS